MSSGFNKCRQAKHTHTHTRTHRRIETMVKITAVLSCYAAVAPSYQITLAHAHTPKCEMGTVTPDLAGSEGHGGIVTKLPSNRRHISFAVGSPWSRSGCIWDEYVNMLMTVLHLMFAEKCIQCMGGFITDPNTSPLPANRASWLIALM